MGRFTVVMKIPVRVSEVAPIEVAVEGAWSWAVFFPSLAFAFGCFYKSIISFAQPVARYDNLLDRIFEHNKTIAAKCM